ncbi:aminotransferase class I/II-fold pyridoxal phosphate-dependent enzyme [Actinoplanes bogorensis]|uniref:cysteine-S-conjugate beta-lyase n=1 Tax=Paractinoplanes bogorensis TaxID=1610840 RepID=A0ABS5YRG7_9ACTN|nr:aminotransferase class I/II-fold pyridoxal phosphate-dependent enzyme [Actinoplanes bogorensis]MBU2665941.1 aminotransferase class I/II-fold pyridoxal phosphate-dependent enzyme [Actinoplanes bogorensis]
MSAELVVPPLAELRQRRSVKWRTFADDVLPLFVAEMDYELAPPVTEVLGAALSRGDLGYYAPGPEVGQAFAGFAGRQWGWDVDPGRVTAVTDVGVGVVEVLRQLVRPGDPVVISPPVYPPFFDWVPEARGRAIEVPLTDGRLDLAGLEAAFATHPAAYVLCNPQNPVGRVHTADELTELARLARLYRVPVISDEIHAALVLPGATFTPFLAVPGAAEIAIGVVSASKAFNLAGLKCAALVTASPAMTRVVDALVPEVRERTGHLGALASIAAWTDGDSWLESLLGTLSARRSQLGALLGESLPTLSWRPPEATYLAWLDASALGQDTKPRDLFLYEGKVALEPGTRFGAVGSGHVRLNYATSPEILAEAVRRMATAAGGTAVTL